MKNLILPLFIFSVFSTSAQQTSHNDHSFICSYYGEAVSTPLTGFNSSAEAREVISSIIEVIGLAPKFEIRSANIPNAAAVISSGQRYILYNPNFINAINAAAKDRWASIAILAHEIGHHLNGHTLLGSGSRPSIELEADEFSGFVLRKMGASLHQSQLSMQIVADVRASRTHPARHDRLLSIENGWRKADAQMAGRTYTPKPVVSNPAPVSPERTTATVSRYVLSKKYIRMNVMFHNDKSSPYYITTGNNLVTIKNNQLIILGKATASNNSNFPIMIVVEGRPQFFIHKNGSIVTPQRREVGKIVLH